MSEKIDLQTLSNNSTVEVLQVQDAGATIPPKVLVHLGNVYRGKSAYEQAQNGGYQGRLAEFNEQLAKINNMLTTDDVVDNLDSYAEHLKPLSAYQGYHLNTIKIGWAEYSSERKEIVLYSDKKKTIEIGAVDATLFIKDGMIDKVSINPDTQIITITFNTDAGKTDIEVNLALLLSKKIDIVNDADGYIPMFDKNGQLSPSSFREIELVANDNRERVVDYENADNYIYIPIFGSGGNGLAYLESGLWRMKVPHGDIIVGGTPYHISVYAPASVLVTISDSTYNIIFTATTENTRNVGVVEIDDYTKWQVVYTWNKESEKWVLKSKSKRQASPSIIDMRTLNVGENLMQEANDIMYNALPTLMLMHINDMHTLIYTTPKIVINNGEINLIGSISIEGKIYSQTIFCDGEGIVVKIGEVVSSNDYTDKDKEVVDRLAEFNPEEISTTSMYLTTYSDLRTLKKEGKLIPGAFYRITDFVTKTATTYTRSAGHPFDIIVQALDEHTLSENAQAILHEGDTYFANSNLDAWQVWYNFDNETSRFAWAKAWVEESPASWKCGLGLIEERYDTGASTAYTTAVVDGKTKYLYCPAEPTNHLEGKEFYEKVLIGSITSPEGFIYEADNAPENYGDEEYDNWYWDDVTEIRVKTADGTLVATLSNYGGGEFIDYERDEMGDYYINMHPNAVWNEEKGVYIYTPNYGVQDWWDNCVGSIDTYDKVPYTGSIDSLYYAFDSILPKSSKTVTEVYSPDTGKIYYSDSFIDNITYKSYQPFVEGHKGVIYRLIDEFNNDLPYDFKTIQFKYEDEWFYTFGVEDNSVKTKTVCNNIFSFSEAKLVPIIIKGEKSVNNTITIDAYGNEYNEDYLVFESNVYNNTITLLRFYAPAKFSGEVHDSTICGDISTGLSAGAITFSTILCYNGDITLDCDFFQYGYLKQEHSTPITLSATRFRNITFVGAGTLKVVDSNGNKKAIYGGNFHTGLSGSNIKLVDNQTSSVSNRLEGIDLNIPNKGTSEIVVDVSDFPRNAGYTLNIATDSQGNVKKWCDADLV